MISKALARQMFPEEYRGYRWVITRDWDYERETRRGADHLVPSRKGVCGPADYDASIPLTKRFRLYCVDGDEDGLTYEGMASETADFMPLDDFGEPDAGCNCIKYWDPETKTWEVL